MVFRLLSRSVAGVAAGALSGLVTAGPGLGAEAIRIGAPLSLTGSLADEGSKEQQGLDMCIDAVNARGGVQIGSERRRLEAVKYDYQSETNRAIQLVQRLLTVDKVNFLFSPYGSGDTKATAVLAERYNVPMIASSAATESVYDQKLTTLFGILFANHATTEAEVNYYKERIVGPRKVAVIAMNSLYPKAIAGDLRQTAAKTGYEIVFDGLYSPGMLDFSNVLTQIKGAGPSWIYATGYIQELITMRRQMASLGVTAQVVTMTAGAAYPEFAQNLGPLADNVTSNSWWHPSATYKDSYIFGSAPGYAREFESKNGKVPTYLEAAATAGCEVLAEAIEEAGTVAPDAVKKVLHERRFETFYGAIKFGPSGQNEVASPVLLQIQKGRYAVLDPDAVKTGDLVIGVGAP